jgi:hypothetical protein
MLALQTKMKIETDRRELRAIDPVTKQDGPAIIPTLRAIIEQFPDSPQSLVARNRLALTFAQLNRHQESADMMEEIVVKSGDTTPAELLWRLGETYERRLNDQVKAREAYAKIPRGSARYNDAQRKLNRK